MQTGERTGSWAVLMNAVVDKLSVDDMLDIAAYVGAQKP
jgi:cytochrome c553